MSAQTSMMLPVGMTGAEEAKFYEVEGEIAARLHDRGLDARFCSVEFENNQRCAAIKTNGMRVFYMDMQLFVEATPDEILAVLEQHLEQLQRR